MLIAGLWDSEQVDESSLWSVFIRGKMELARCYEALRLVARSKSLPKQKSDRDLDHLSKRENSLERNGHGRFLAIWQASKAMGRTTLVESVEVPVVQELAYMILDKSRMHNSCRAGLFLWWGLVSLRQKKTTRFVATCLNGITNWNHDQLPPNRLFG